MTTVHHADIARLKRINPELFSRPLGERLRDWSLWLAFLATLLFGLWWIDASPTRIWDGLSKLGFLVRRRLADILARRLAQNMPD